MKGMIHKADSKAQKASPRRGSRAVWCNSLLHFLAARLERASAPLTALWATANRRPIRAVTIS